RLRETGFGWSSDSPNRLAPPRAGLGLLVDRDQLERIDPAMHLVDWVVVRISTACLQEHLSRHIDAQLIVRQPNTRRGFRLWVEKVEGSGFRLFRTRREELKQGISVAAQGDLFLL